MAEANQTLETLAEQALAEARRELEQTGRITPTFVARFADGSVQKAAMPPEAAEGMNSGAYKTQLFEGIRSIIQKTGIVALAFVVDMWMSRTTEKGVELMNRDPDEFERLTQRHKCEEAVEQGLMVHSEVISVTTQDAKGVTSITQPYTRNDSDAPDHLREALHAGIPAIQIQRSHEVLWRPEPGEFTLMPLLDAYRVHELLVLAQAHRRCNDYGHKTAMDCCRSCDEYYWIHLPGCAMYEDKHFGHRLYLMPFVEER
jgi:hypothetical protein